MFYSFLEEVWSRNLGHLFVTPLRPYELAVSLMVVSFMKTTVGLVPASFLAILFFDFSIYSLGLPLAGFYLNLMAMGWAIGLIMAGLIMRYGMGAENLAWGTAFILTPLTAIYYPVAVLPGWLQPVSLALPSTHVFEGMRAILIDGAFRPDLMLNATLLNVLYMVGGVAAFLGFFRVARQRGLLLNLGE
jgi:ABC-2 type transport system permease protein